MIEIERERERKREERRERERFIVKSWLMCLWQLRSPKSCTCPAGDPGGRPENQESQHCQFQEKWLQAPAHRRADFSVQVQRQEMTNPSAEPSGSLRALLFSGGSAFVFYSGLQLIG